MGINVLAWEVLAKGREVATRVWEALGWVTQSLSFKREPLKNLSLRVVYCK